MDAKTIASKGLESAFRVFRKDLLALPEDVFNKCLGGKARTVADIVYEVNRVNDDIELVVRGEAPSVWPEGWLTAPADMQTKEAVIAAFEESAQRVLSTADSYTSDELEANFMSDEGETTRFERFRFIALHTWYHSGQLNFIQTLLGDDEFHWAK
jgi:hypothetical protein